MLTLILFGTVGAGGETRLAKKLITARRIAEPNVVKIKPATGNQGVRIRHKKLLLEVAERKGEIL